MKKYIDIENLREFDIDLGDGMIREKNCQAFELGDEVVISEKIDGSNFSIRFNEETGEFDAFSRNKQLDEDNTLNGAYEFAKSLKINNFPKDIVVFGEWTGVRNRITYNEECRGKWYVFDVYNDDLGYWWHRKSVDQLCDVYGWNTAHTFYEGKFKGWDHVRSFLHKPQYGEVQEGVVISNQSKLWTPGWGKKYEYPIVLKIVNDEFRESKIPRTRPDNDEREALKAKAAELASEIVTHNRVSKMLLKLRDEGVLPSNITPQDMGAVAKNLPKRIYEDCVKEEPEIVEAMGEYAGKTIARVAIKTAKEILL